MSALDFLATDAAARRRAVERLAACDLADAAVVYGLRRLLASDRDVAVRALAAGALGSVRAAALPDPRPWLVTALADESPVVRDAAIRAVARHAAPAAYAPLCTLARTDTTWWVRRAAVYALGVLGTTHGDPVVPARAALADPFWRVRHAAVQVLTIYGNRSPERRPEILADVSGGTAEYLRALWGPTLVDDSPREPIASRLPPALLDRDPAVVTARLADMASPPPLGLVELLCDPHVPLRTLAAARLLEANDDAAFAAALNWLDEPRIPHVAATVTAMLDTLGDPARALVERVLSAPARPGASRWAIGWIVATRSLDLADAAWRRAMQLGEPALALPIAPDASLVELLAPDVPTEDAVAAADELLARPSHVRRPLLASIAPHAQGAVQMRLAAATAGIELDDSAHIDAALASHDPLARATALALRGASLSRAAREEALLDGDPAVREAVIAQATPAELASLVEHETDPWVRRAAAQAILRVAHAVDTTALVMQLAVDPDAWIRTRAIPHLDPTRADHLAQIAVLAADTSPMVQSAIIDKLAAISDEQLATLTTPALDAWRSAAALDDDAATDATTDATTDTATDAATDARAGAVVVRRAFGASGVEAAPLVISGAFDLQPGSLRAAAERGIDTFFWEPAYAGMTKFLRGQRRAQVVTGTYHADAASIGKDVDRALRRLRRDVIDVYLLFWSRSDARLDDQAFEVMAALKRSGKVRAIGFSTHDRSLAMRALDRAPWDVVMTRHNAAHPGIEDAFLAHASAKGAGVLTFSALCYGRMLAGDGAPSATDCYRYSLAQPGVTATISAPRRHRELIENLDVLGAAALTDDELARVREHGRGVRVESQRFNALIRQPTRDAAAAAMAMLEAELAPDGDREEACVTPAALQRSLSSRGRGRASLPSAMLRRGRL